MVRCKFSLASHFHKCWAVIITTNNPHYLIQTHTALTTLWFCRIYLRIQWIVFVRWSWWDKRCLFHRRIVMLLFVHDPPFFISCVICHFANFVLMLPINSLIFIPPSCRLFERCVGHINGFCKQPTTFAEMADVLLHFNLTFAIVYCMICIRNTITFAKIASDHLEAVVVRWFSIFSHIPPLDKFLTYELCISA